MNVNEERPKRSILAAIKHALFGFIELICTIFVDFSIMLYWLESPGSSSDAEGNKSLLLLNTKLGELFGAGLNHNMLIYLNYAIAIPFLLTGLVSIFFDATSYRRFVLLPFFLLMSLEIILGVVKGARDGSLLKTELGQVWPLYGDFLVMAGHLLL